MRLQKEVNGTFVSTIELSKCHPIVGLFDELAGLSHPFETAVQNPEYNDGNLVVVEQYHSFEAAKKGHEKWLSIAKKNLPETIRDVNVDKDRKKGEN